MLTISTPVKRHLCVQRNEFKEYAARYGSSRPKIDSTFPSNCIGTNYGWQLIGEAVEYGKLILKNLVVIVDVSLSCTATLYTMILNGRLT